MTTTAATTTDEKTSAARGLPLSGARRALALLLCLSCPPLALAQAGAEAARRPQRPEETVDSVLTAAGALAIVRPEPDGGMEMELRLNGRKVADVDGALYAGFKAHFRGMDSGEVVVMRVSDGGSGCPAQFRLVRVVDESRVTLTEEFGDCSDSPDITLRQLPEEELLFRFPGFYRLIDGEQPGFRKPPPTTWVYRKGALRELKPAAKRRG
ncbi:MAG TPA: hypothetical protein VF668_10965 [Pyrinomonadaceae bacterium]|jgi:hypothetical protein